MEKEFRDISITLARRYVASLPDCTPDGDMFHGPDWTITLRELEPVPVGPMCFSRVHFVLRGSPAATERVWGTLQHRFIRGGA
jgi:hypothetical protein